MAVHMAKPLGVGSALLLLAHCTSEPLPTSDAARADGSGDLGSARQDSALEGDAVTSRDTIAPEDDITATETSGDGAPVDAGPVDDTASEADATSGSDTFDTPEDQTILVRDVAQDVLTEPLDGTLVEASDDAGDDSSDGTNVGDDTDVGDDGVETGAVIELPAGTLDGVHSYADDVVVRSGTIVRAPTGFLKIIARSITIEPNASIVIEPTSRVWRSSGVPIPGGPVTCSACGMTNSLVIVGSGGAYATAGTGDLVYPVRGGLGCGGCSVERPGLPAQDGYSTYDELGGSPGTPCNYGINNGVGGNGGGVAVLIADEIDVQGVISASGQSGYSVHPPTFGPLPSPPYDCAAGGSGGHVIFRAEKRFALSGTISVRGGNYQFPGAGGDGLVNVLTGRGATVVGGGRINGQGLNWGLVGSRISTPPGSPATVKRTYNDGTGPIEFEWPARSANDTYNVSLTPVLSCGASAFRTVTAAHFELLPNEHCWNGQMNIDVSGASGNVGSMLLSFVSQPVAVRVSSVSGSTATFAWDLVGEADELEYRWVLDEYGDTLPTTADARVLEAGSESRRVEVPNIAPGAWMFHLRPYDLGGGPTTTAANVRIEMGDAPPGALNGTVSIGGHSWAGAVVQLNRGLYEVHADNVGAYSFNRVAPGRYELRVRRSDGTPGYQSTVDIVSGTTQTVAISFP